MTPDKYHLLTPDEAARYLRSNRRTLERWRSENAGPPYVKIGRRVAYTREHLDAWILTRERQSTKDPRTRKKPAPRL